MWILYQKKYQIDLKIHAVIQETGNKHTIFKTKRKIGGSNSQFKNYTGKKATEVMEVWY